MKKFKIKQKSNRSGFTLVELVIVIAIVIILSVISVPIYRGYVDKAKWAEGYALLGNILSAQKAYYSEYGNFFSYKSVRAWYWTCNEPSLGIDARGNKYFTWFGMDITKNYFNAQAMKHIDLIKEGKYYLLLQYNITKGSRIIDFDANWAKVKDWAD